MPTRGALEEGCGALEEAWGCSRTALRLPESRTATAPFARGKLHRNVALVERDRLVPPARPNSHPAAALDEAEPRWRELEALLERADHGGVARMTPEEVRRFAALYRRVCGDLVFARSRVVNADVIAYLNELVARAYGHVHVRRSVGLRRAGAFLASGFPRLFRAHRALFLVSAVTFALGGAVGAVALHVEPSAKSVLLPFGHDRLDPAARVAREEGRGARASGESATFTAFLFTHNLRVTFLCFALGLTFGLGTLALLFYNGVGLGALAYAYHEAGVGLFFWAWILPHGVPELFETMLAGAAGLLMGRALALPGERSRGEALREAARDGAGLVLGGAPILVVAGFIEGTFSQVHEPALPYPVKLAFAALLFVALLAYLVFAGRGAPVAMGTEPPGAH